MLFVYILPYHMFTTTDFQVPAYMESRNDHILGFPMREVILCGKICKIVLEIYAPNTNKKF